VPDSVVALTPFKSPAGRLADAAADRFQRRDALFERSLSFGELAQQSFERIDAWCVREARTLIRGSALHRYHRERADTSQLVSVSHLGVDTEIPVLGVSSGIDTG
jgi:hypothetical protein